MECGYGHHIARRRVGVGVVTLLNVVALNGNGVGADGLETNAVHTCVGIGHRHVPDLNGIACDATVVGNGPHQSVSTLLEASNLGTRFTSVDKGARTVDHSPLTNTIEWTVGTQGVAVRTEVVDIFTRIGVGGRTVVHRHGSHGTTAVVHHNPLEGGTTEVEIGNRCLELVGIGNVATAYAQFPVTDTVAVFDLSTCEHC